ncbi:type II toxin-antitoxin system Phd/YefM family antitoxin [Mongoliimonas terrestris]|uniref:type II toxin-antitoxin system Phd/YefM family antitoxin n=1 Tax=Mongoliimonas terrestris TaxID=1709001 RepID=UPI0009497912|nr:type II toxin-antitoxin system prevent-host-death family antitoxin [Mongoliimonas terrestris]
MNKVQLRDAKARLSELVEAVEAGDHVVITKHGREAVMIVPLEEGRKLFPEKEEANFFEYLMKIPYPVELDEEERPRIRDIDL